VSNFSIQLQLCALKKSTKNSNYVKWVVKLFHMHPLLALYSSTSGIILQSVSLKCLVSGQDKLLYKTEAILWAGCVGNHAVLLSICINQCKYNLQVSAVFFYDNLTLTVWLIYNNSHYLFQFVPREYKILSC
jgi:hypothetical protein